MATPVITWVTTSGNSMVLRATMPSGMTHTITLEDLEKEEMVVVHTLKELDAVPADEIKPLGGSVYIRYKK